MKEIPNSLGYVFSLDPTAKKINSVVCLPWREGIKELGIELPD
jgi:hypothetical protein